MYNITIPKSVETKIRLWCHMSPSTEWSGTLFYESEGSFEDNNLNIIVRDFYVQNVGSAGFTEFTEEADVVTYMMDHNLLECTTGLIH